MVGFGLDRLIADPELRRPLAGRRVALLAHPASVTTDLTHALDALAACGDIKLSAAFGPQHGLRGDKQDNMVESPDFQDPVHGIPVFSLYGAVRRPTDAMLDACDVLVVDLQDVGCRIYTFITTLLYVLEGAAIVHTDIYAPLALETGESVYFDGRIGHAILANGSAPCRALLVVAGDETPSQLAR